MAIIFILLYSACLVGLWFLLKAALKALFKEKYRHVYLVTGYFILLPFAIIALGFLALALIPESL